MKPTKPEELAGKLLGVVLVVTALIVLAIDQIAVWQPPFWKETDRITIIFTISFLFSVGFFFFYPNIPQPAGVHPKFFKMRIRAATIPCALCLIAFTLSVTFEAERLEKFFVITVGFFAGAIATNFVQYLRTLRPSGIDSTTQ